jgi:hypothetical protein
MKMNQPTLFINLRHKRIWQILYILSAVAIVVLAVPAFLEVIADGQLVKRIGAATAVLVISCPVLILGRFREPPYAGKLAFNICLIVALLGVPALVPAPLLLLVLYFLPKKQTIAASAKLDHA